MEVQTESPRSRRSSDSILCFRQCVKLPRALPRQASELPPLLCRHQLAAGRFVRRSGARSTSCRIPLSCPSDGSFRARPSTRGCAAATRSRRRQGTRNVIPAGTPGRVRSSCRIPLRNRPAPRQTTEGFCASVAHVNATYSDRFRTATLSALRVGLCAPSQYPRHVSGQPESIDVSETPGRLGCRYC